MGCQTQFSISYRKFPKEPSLKNEYKGLPTAVIGQLTFASMALNIIPGLDKAENSVSASHPHDGAREHRPRQPIPASAYSAAASGFATSSSDFRSAATPQIPATAPAAIISTEASR